MWGVVAVAAHILSLPESEPPLHPLQGHVERIIYVEFSPDSKLLTTAGVDRTVKVWSTRTWTVVRVLRHDGPVHFLSFSPDGRFLASVGDDQRLKIWEVGSWRKVREIPLPHGRDGRFLGGYGGGAVSLSRDWARAAVFKGSVVEVWDLRRRRRIFLDDARASAKAKGYGYAGWVGSWFYDTVCLSPDGRLLAATVYRWYPEVVRIWDVDSGKLLYDLRGHGHSCVTCVTFSRDCRLLASGSRDTTVIVWDLSTGKMLHRFFGPKEWAWVDSVAFSPDGRLVAAGYFGEHYVRVFDVKAGRQVALLDCRPLWVDSPVAVERVAFSPDGRFLAAASGEGVGIWRVGDWKLTKVLATALRDVLSVSALPGPKLLAWGDYFGRARIFDFRSRKVLSTPAHPTHLSSVALSPDGRLLASGDEEGWVCLWRLPRLELVRKWRAHNRPICFLCFSPGGRVLATGGREGRVRLWDVGSGRMAGEARGRVAVLENPAFCGDFSADGKLLAVGFADGPRVWEVGTGKLVEHFGEAGLTRGLCFCGKLLLLLPWDKGLWALDPGRGWKEVGRAGVRLGLCVAPSPDGRVAAVGGADGRVHLVEVPSMRVVLSWRAHDAKVASLCFLGEGLLASSGTDGVVRVWDLRAGRLLFSLASAGPGEVVVAKGEG